MHVILKIHPGHRAMASLILNCLDVLMSHARAGKDKNSLSVCNIMPWLYAKAVVLSKKELNASSLFMRIQWLFAICVLANLTLELQNKT